MKSISDIEPRSPTLSRRSFVQGSVVVGGGALLGLLPAMPAAAAGGLNAATRKATEQSPLIYVSPLRSDGSESQCHAEIWFARDPGSQADELMVVTPPERWRSRAVKQGLERARIWVGDHGVWKSSGEKFRSSPSFVAQASLLAKDDPAVARVLEAMSTKYATTGWSKWGPRFQKGLADESRVMVRYRPIEA
jgi:hypothetical protein